MADAPSLRLGTQLVPPFTLIAKALGTASGIIGAINADGVLEVIHSSGKAPETGATFEWHAGVCGEALESGKVAHRRLGGGRGGGHKGAECGWESGMAVAVPVKIEGATPTVMAFHLARVTQLSQASLSLITMGAELCDSLVNSRLLMDKIAASQREWQTMIDHLPIGIVLLDREFRVKRCNQAFASWSGGAAPKAIIGKRCHEVLHGAESPHPSCPHLASMLNARQVTGEFDTGGRLLEITAIPMTDEHGAYLYTMEFLVDITERRTMQKNLVTSERMAALAQLSAKTAHEINNPLAFVQSNLGALESNIDEVKRLLVAVELTLTSRDHGEWERQKTDLKKLVAEIDLPKMAGESDQLLAEMKEGSRRIANIVKQLDMFNVKSAAVRPAKRTQLEAVADRAIEMVRTMTEGARIDTDYGVTAPVLVDPSGMGHALIEICDYLMKTTNDLDRITFRTRTEHGNSVLEIRCAATGAGTALLQPEGSETLLHNLHLAYGILQENGCRYDLSKSPGEGPTFTLSAPAAPGA
ncbi:MAG: PAS domain-containing protein [Deltaproteobacteria bacterium]|nr:PAS domain-containing protein [Deltaproteobacteria bacterium]